MRTFIKKGLALGLLGVAIWCLASLMATPNFSPGRIEHPAAIFLTAVNLLLEVSSAWGQGVSGSPPVY